MMKLEKLYEEYPDGTKEVKGYKVEGKELYLMKHYTWCNEYSWIINRDGRDHYFATDFSYAVDNGEVVICNSFKDGKKKLVEML